MGFVGVFFLSFFIALSSFAVEVRDFTYGVELTAVTPDNSTFHIGRPVDGKKIDFVRLAAREFARLTGGSVLPVGNFNEIPVRNAWGEWYFENDHGALEVASPVLRFGDFEALGPVFRAFRAVGLKPEVSPGGVWGGGGHMHLGRQIFDTNPLLLRNFVVDVMNKPFIQEMLGEPEDDQALSLRARGLLKKLAPELAKLDRRFARGELVTADDVARTFIRAFHDGTDRRAPRGWSIYSWPARYLDVNLTNILTGLHPTVELRMMRAPRSAREARARALLFTRYLQKLDGVTQPIPLKMRVPGGEVGARWNRFLRGLGLEPSEFRSEFRNRCDVVLGG